MWHASVPKYTVILRPPGAVFHPREEVQLCQRGPGGSAAPFLWVHSHLHYGGQDHQVAGGCSPVVYHVCGGGTRVYLCLGGTVWHAI